MSRALGILFPGQQLTACIRILCVSLDQLEHEHVDSGVEHPGSNPTFAVS